MSGGGASFAATWGVAADAAGRAQHRQLWQGMGAWERHKRLMHDLATLYRGGAGGGGGKGSRALLPEKTDYDVLREHHRFIRSEQDDAQESWEVRLAKRYYSKLFKEYAVADLSKHQEGRVGLRWRTQREVVSGKGQFVCGAKGCEERRGLASFEVPFAYEEAGERRQALVKVRVCPTHAYQLNYRKRQEEEERERRRQERWQRRRERRTRGAHERAEGEEEAEPSKKSSKRRHSDADDQREQSKKESRSKRRRRSGQQRSGSSERRDGSGSSAEEGGGRLQEHSRRGDAAVAGAGEDEEFETFLRGLMD